MAYQSDIGGRRPRDNHGFTLIEILIVVTILAIIATIVVPKFSSAQQDARKSALASELQTLRSQIQTYRLQHGDALPDLRGGTDGVAPVTTNWNPLTTVTTYSGKNFGPYVKTTPKNPLNSLGKVIDGNATATGYSNGTACGYIYDYNSGVGSGRIWGTDTNSTSVYVE
jgi:prepilin-type N-terminal cleavage/methylation domain-containing protein